MLMTYCNNTNLKCQIINQVNNFIKGSALV